MIAILRRELVGLLRTRRAVAVQLSLALAFALLILLRWPTEARVGLSGAQARQVLRVFGYGLLASVLLLVPAFPATSIIREKMQGTLALLLTSPLRAWSIYLGKLGGVLGLVAILLLMTAPASAACYTLGGTSFLGEIVPLYLVLFLAAVQISTLALLVSSCTSATEAALRVAYGMVLLVTVVSLGPYALLQGTEGELTEAAAWLRCLSPIPAVMEILGQGDVGGQGIAAGYRITDRYLLLGTLSSLGFLLATVFRLSRHLFDRPRPPGVMTEDRSGLARAGRRVFFLIDPQRRSGSIGRFTNPVMVKEFRCRRFGRSHWMLRLLSFCAVASLGLTYVALFGVLDWGVDTIGGILVLLQVALIILLTPSLSSGLISAERESGGWELLRMTPLSPGAILRGKLLSVVWPLMLVLGATLPGYLVMVLLEPTLVPRVVRVLGCLLLTAAFAVLSGAAVGSLFRHAAAATTAAYLLLVTLCLGTMLFWLGLDAPFGHATVQAALVLNPLAATLYAADTPGFTQFELLPANWWFLGAGCVASLVLLTWRTWQLTRPE